MFRLNTRAVSRQLQSIRLVSTGSLIPLTTLKHNSPGNDFNLADAVKSGKNVIVGVPGAFSPACSATHVPGYGKLVNDFKNKGYNNIYVVAVNDPFVTKAWGDDLGTPESVVYLADPAGEFSKDLGTLFASAKIFGNDRSKRYALLVEDGKVKKAFEEPDNVSVDVSDASKVLSEA